MFDFRRLTKLFPTEPPPPPPPIPAGVWFIDAKPGQCRWPLWGGSEPIEGKAVCGRQTDGTYCRGHAEVAYRRDV
jgi:hypothetical protein